MGLSGGGGFAILPPTVSCISEKGTMKIGGVYILSRRSITRMIKAIATAFAALCIYTSSFGDMLLASRYANTTQSLLSLKCSLKCDAARTVVPDLLYLEGKALYFKAKSSGAARSEIAPYQAAATSATPPRAAVAGRPPYHCEAAGFLAELRKKINEIHDASVLGKPPPDKRLRGLMRQKQVLYGVGQYKPQEVSFEKAARMAIIAFKGEHGAYGEREWKSLKQAIRRHVLGEREKFAT